MVTKVRHLLIIPLDSLTRFFTLLMACVSLTKQHAKKEYAKTNMFYMRRLVEEKKKETIELHLFCPILSKLNLPPPLDKNGNNKEKKKVKPSKGNT